VGIEEVLPWERATVERGSHRHRRQRGVQHRGEPFLIEVLRYLQPPGEPVDSTYGGG